MSTFQERASSIGKNDVEKDAYKKIKATMECVTNRQKLMDCLEIFYNNAKGEQPWTQSQSHFLQMNIDQLKEITLKIFAEAINRDMIDYIQTGTRGNLAQLMFRKLKSE